MNRLLVCLTCGSCWLAADRAEGAVHSFSSAMDFVSKRPTQPKTNVCSNTGCTTNIPGWALFPCLGGCGRTLYCSSKCQSMHWQAHQKVCQAVKNQRAGSPSKFVRPPSPYTTAATPLFADFDVEEGIVPRRPKTQGAHDFGRQPLHGSLSTPRGRLLKTREDGAMNLRKTLTNVDIVILEPSEPTTGVQVATPPSLSTEYPNLRTSAEWEGDSAAQYDGLSDFSGDISGKKKALSSRSAINDRPKTEPIGMQIGRRNRIDMERARRRHSGQLKSNETSPQEGSLPTLHSRRMKTPPPTNQSQSRRSSRDRVLVSPLTNTQDAVGVVVQRSRTTSPRLPLTQAEFEEAIGWTSGWGTGTACSSNSNSGCNTPQIAPFFENEMKATSTRSPKNSTSAADTNSEKTTSPKSTGSEASVHKVSPFVLPRSVVISRKACYSPRNSSNKKARSPRSSGGIPKIESPKNNANAGSHDKKSVWHGPKSVKKSQKCDVAWSPQASRANAKKAWSGDLARQNSEGLAFEPDRRERRTSEELLQTLLTESLTCDQNYREFQQTRVLN